MAKDKKNIITKIFHGIDKHIEKVSSNIDWCDCQLAFDEITKKREELKKE